MTTMKVRLVLALLAIGGACGPALAQDPVTPVAAPAKDRTIRPDDQTTTASVARPLGDPDAEISYLRPRRVIAPPIYGEPGPPLNPGGVPYDELFASPYPFDIPSALALPDDDPYFQ